MSIKELTSVKQDQRDLDWLKSALQAAVELEFFTIPPYLTAMWSVEEQLPSRAGSNGSDGSADAHAADTADAADAADAQAADAQAAGGEVRLSAAHLLRSIVYEEMEHMALACNMLAAIGGTPRINRGSAVPTYPRPMPGGVNPRLVVALGGLTPESVKTFMEIEQPEKPLQFPTEALVRGETFPRIAEFYSAVREVFTQLFDNETLKMLDVERQITGPLAPMTVATLDDVKNAIHRICVQGEGTTAQPTSDGLPPAGMTELAHYYQFQQLDRRQILRLNPNTNRFAWTPEQFPFPAVFPVAPIPAGGYRYDEVPPRVAAELRRFDDAYTHLLDELQGAWTGRGQAALLKAIEWMFALEGPARALMQMPIPGTAVPATNDAPARAALTYGPNFRYLGPA